MKLFFIILLINISCFAAEDVYQFIHTTDSVRFQQLTHHLRCLVCQNQNLAESNSMFASNMRDLIYKKILVGESDQQILKFLTDRYGNYILYKPHFVTHTMTLWIIPFLVLFLALSLLIHRIRRE